MKMLRDRRGDAAVSIIFVMVFVLLLAVTFTLGRAYTVRTQVSDELNRALNTALQLSMMDEYRRDHISHIDVIQAEDEVYNYLAMIGISNAINGNMVMERDGETQFRLEVDELTFTAEPPQATISGTVYVPLRVFQSMGAPLEIEFPFRIAARNQRVE